MSKNKAKEGQKEVFKVKLQFDPRREFVHNLEECLKLELTEENRSELQEDYSLEFREKRMHPLAVDLLVEQQSKGSKAFIVRGSGSEEILKLTKLLILTELQIFKSSNINSPEEMKIVLDILNVGSNSLRGVELSFGQLHPEGAVTAVLEIAAGMRSLKRLKIPFFEENERSKEAVTKIFKKGINLEITEGFEDLKKTLEDENLVKSTAGDAVVATTSIAPRSSERLSESSKFKKNTSKTCTIC